MSSSFMPLDLTALILAFSPNHVVLFMIIRCKTIPVNIVNVKRPKLGYNIALFYQFFF